MRRFLSLTAVVLVLTASAQAQDGRKMTLRWHGQSFFELKTTAGTRIVFDPHAIDEYGRREVEADLILISHPHNDHTQVGVVSNHKEATKIEGVKDPKGDGKKQEWNVVDQKFKDVQVRTVGVYHDAMQGMQRGKNGVFIVEADGLRIVHLGDLGHVLTPGDVKKIGRVDVLLIPVGGVYTINGSEAKRVVAQLKPTRYIVPMHYGTKAYNDLLPADEFLDEQKRETIKRYRTNEITFDPKAPPPAEPQIILLNYTDGRGE